MAFPNPWNSPDFYQRVKIGGRPILASFVEVDGIKIEDEWDAQKPTGSSGATNVFKGTKAAGPAKLTFEAVSPEEFDDLREIYELLAPKPGSGANGTGSTAGSPGSAAYGKGFMQDKSSSSAAATPSLEDLLKSAQQSLAAVNSGANTAAAAAGSSSSGSSSSNSTGTTPPNPGPKPPTLSIENGYLNYVGINAISRKSWDGPRPTPTNSFRVILEVVLQREPTPAAVGAAAPKSADNPGQKSIAFGEIQDPASSAKDANTSASQWMAA